MTDIRIPGMVIQDEIAALRRCTAAGADLTLAEPFRVAHLVAAIDAVLRPPAAV